MTGGLHAWEQHPEETPRAFAAFASYRNLPANIRSIDAAWRRIRSTELNATIPAEREELQALPSTRAPKTWRDWSSRYAWVTRSLAWDAELDRQARARLVADHKQMLEKHRTLGAGLLQKAAEALTSMAAADMQARDVIGAIRVGVQVERQAFELPDAIVEQRHTGSIQAHVEGGLSLEHHSDAYDTIIRLLLEAPDAVIVAADRLAGRLAAAPSLPRAEAEPRQALPSTPS